MAAEPGWVSKWILGYGLARFVFTTFIAAHSALTARDMLRRALLGVLAGVLFGALMWTFPEWRFRRVRASPPWQPPQHA